MRAALAVIVGVFALVSPVALPAHAAPVKPDVVNGDTGPSDDFGFLIALGDRDLFEAYGMGKAQFCGGSLATATLVVTAAHCVVNTTARQLVVGSPGPDGDLDGAGMVTSNVKAIKVYSRYNEQSQSGDVAVLTLATPLRGVPTILPVTEAEAETLTAPRAPVSVAGWGAINGSKPWRFPSVYNVGDLIVFPESSCGGGESFTVDGIRFDGYGPGEVNPRAMLCAEGVTAGKIVDSCVGDSGGPLIGGAGDARRLVGIVSWGLSNCATKSGAGVYTRVSAYTAFLKSAGIPFVPTPVEGPQPPTITGITSTNTSITVTIRPSAQGDDPTSYTVSALDQGGHITSCSMDAPPRPATAKCTINGLSSEESYEVTAISIAGDLTSAPSAAVTTQPKGAPSRPRITYTKTYRGGLAGFIVENLHGNGSPLTERRVTCSSAGQPTRAGTIESGGVAIVSRLKSGRTYSCAAVVANAYGRATSRAVRVTAR